VTGTLTSRGENPPHIQSIPKSIEYLRIYPLEMAYVEPPQQSEAPRAFRRMYEMLRTTQLAINKHRDVRITLLYPTTDWDRVWSKLRATWAADAIRAKWFRMIHDILPTNERLHTIRLTDSVVCSTYGERYNHAQDNKMWGGAGNLGMEKTYRLDIAHGSGLDSPRVDPSTAVPYMATTRP
jgi:hypothetical protein